MKEIKLQYIPTGIVFNLPVEEALKIYNESRGNDYKILDEGYVKEDPKEEETTVYQQIIEEEITEKDSDELDTLKKEADELGVKYGKTIGIDTLRKRIEEFKAQ